MEFNEEQAAPQAHARRQLLNRLALGGSAAALDLTNLPANSPASPQTTSPASGCVQEVAS